MNSQNSLIANSANSNFSLRRRGAFTLVELLVVIGIIALLISILLPALSKARKAANSVKCLANLRSLVQAATQHANDHKGYLPPAGWIFSPTGLATPGGMFDPRMEKYMYYSEGATMRPLGMVPSLAKYMGQDVDTTSRTSVENDLKSGVSVKMMLCPADRDGGWLGYTFSEAGASWYAPASVMSYAFNESICGFGETTNGGDGSGTQVARLRGNLAKIRTPALVLFAGDATANRAGTQAGSANLLVFYGLLGNQPLADAANDSNAGEAAVFDVVKHDRRMNIAFCDGHADVITIGHPNSTALDAGPNSDLAKKVFLRVD